MILRFIITWAMLVAALSAAPLGNDVSHTTLTNPSAIEITDATGKHLRLRAYGNNMIRVQASESATFFPDDRYLMVEHHNHGGALSVLRNPATRAWLWQLFWTRPSIPRSATLAMPTGWMNPTVSPAPTASS